MPGRPTHSRGTTRRRSSRPVAPTAGAQRPRTSDQAPYHRRTRQAHRSELAEDYVEAIADLIDSEGEARVVDIAKCLGVTHVTVIRTVARLHRAGLVTTRPYRSIFLTNEGRALAEQVRRRHEIVVRFLRAVGVDDESARTDAEGIEHHVSAKTLAAFERFVGER